MNVNQPLVIYFQGVSLHSPLDQCSSYVQESSMSFKHWSMYLLFHSPSAAAFLFGRSFFNLSLDSAGMFFSPIPSAWTSTGNSFCTGRFRYAPFPCFCPPSFTVAALTSPSAPGSNFTTLPNFQVPLLVFPSSITVTMSPSLITGALLVCPLTWWCSRNSTTYSLLHLVQKCARSKIK